jgi:hypothetical protein
MKKEFGSNYASISDVNFKAKYRASCFCNAVQYEVCSDPVDAKICHCLACQKLHGAPMQWAAIFHKHDVRITEGIDHLNFYNNKNPPCIFALTTPDNFSVFPDFVISRATHTFRQAKICSFS